MLKKLPKTSSFVADEAGTGNGDVWWGEGDSAKPVRMTYSPNKFEYLGEDEGLWTCPTQSAYINGGSINLYYGKDKVRTSSPSFKQLDADYGAFAGIPYFHSTRIEGAIFIVAKGGGYAGGKHDFSDCYFKGVKIEDQVAFGRDMRCDGHSLRYLGSGYAMDDGPKMGTKGVGKTIHYDYIHPHWIRTYLESYIFCLRP